MTVVGRAEVIEYLNPSPSETTSSETNEMGQDAFLKLLITQMQNQDPLNPMEGIEFTQQLAQFSSLEQLMAINSGFSSLNTTLEAQNNFQVLDMVGKDIKAVGEYLGYKDGQATGGIFNLPKQASQVMVNIYDDEGHTVRTLDLGAMQAGNHDLNWDGFDQYGHEVDEGLYTFEVLASDLGGSPIDVVSAIQGRVTGVTFGDDGTPALLLNGLMVALADVIEVSAPSTAGEEEE